MILYSFRRCPYAMRARLALRYAGVAVRIEEVSLKAKPAEMLALSPKGTVPVLDLGGRVLEESLEIMRWALDQHDPQDWRLQGDPQIDALIARNDGEFKLHLNHYKYVERYPEYSREHYRQQAEVILADLERKHAPSTRRRGRFAEGPWLRAAAVAAVLLGIGLLATPLPATIGSWEAERWSELISRHADDPASNGRAPAQEAGHTRVEFALLGNELFLEFTTRQSGGTVILRSADVDLVSAEVIRGGDAGADLLVLPRGLRVQNTAETTADYRVVVPRGTIRSVRVRIGNEEVIVLPAAELAGGKQLDLSTREAVAHPPPGLRAVPKERKA